MVLKIRSCPESASRATWVTCPESWPFTSRATWATVARPIVIGMSALASFPRTRETRFPPTAYAPPTIPPINNSVNGATKTPLSQERITPHVKHVALMTVGSDKHLIALLNVPVASTCPVDVDDVDDVDDDAIVF